VRSEVTQSDIRTFVTALEGASVPITKDNIGGLTRLCEEFQFGALSERPSQFCESEELKEDVTQKDLEARKRLSLLEERIQQRDREIAALRTELSRHMRLHESCSELLLGRVARLEAVVSPLITAPASALAHSTVSAENERFQCYSDCGRESNQFKAEMVPSGFSCVRESEKIYL
jgi:hypothetical protein